VFAEWEADLAHLRAPGLVLWGENDTFAAPRFADRMGELARARRVVRLADCGRWWQCQRPDETAAALVQHWRIHAE
jgi:pimeloyl-ACP methyl ester carboxylesterase